MEALISHQFSVWKVSPRIRGCPIFGTYTFIFSVFAFSIILFTGYPGGLKQETAKNLLARRPE
ncbi:MAG TPA: hypothetical protein VFO37_14115, partial [Chitinophagaceae bacterium]|nr:hypothetical protein [Chitinophagaceae bacterium]